MRQVPLPTELVELSSKVNYVQQKSRNEFSSSCPACGGHVHSDGSLPDRFIILVRSRATGGPLGLCRKCGHKWWPGKESGQAISEETLRLLEQQAEVYRAQTEEQRAAKLASFTTQELWLELNRRMREEQRAWWESQGVDEKWQNYLKLGYTDSKAYQSGGELMHSPAYTIPYFHANWEFCTMQYRLVNPDNPKDRYRFEGGLGSTYYMVTPSLPISDVAFVFEGAKKGIVAKRYADYPATHLCIPSASDWRRSGILEVVKNCSSVYILLDPDTFVRPKDARMNWMPQAVLFAEAVGKAARIVELPVKADDGFVQYGMEAEDFLEAVKQARRI